jgi:hypothetical protein
VSGFWLAKSRVWVAARPRVWGLHFEWLLGCRFDDVYVVYFKCNKQFIREYPNISNYVREVYQMPGASLLCGAPYFASRMGERGRVKGVRAWARER